MLGFGATPKHIVRVCTYCCISYSTKYDDKILSSLFFLAFGVNSTNRNMSANRNKGKCNYYPPIVITYIPTQNYYAEIICFLDFPWISLLLGMNNYKIKPKDHL